MKNIPTFPNSYHEAESIVSTHTPHSSDPLLFTSRRKTLKHPSLHHRIANARLRIKTIRSSFKLPPLFLCMTVVLLITSACHPKKDTQEATADTLRNPISVTTSEIKKQSIPLTIAHMGSVQTARRAIVPSRLNANIDAVRVKVGQSVMQGDVLVLLDERELKAAVDQAQAEMERTQSDWNRYQILLTERSVTQREADQIRAAFESARANLEAANTRLGYASVKAPFNGVIEQVNFEPGEGVAAGQALLSLEHPGDLEISTHLPRHMASDLEIGSTLTYSTGLNDLSKVAIITELANVADPSTRTIAGILQISSPTNLKAGDIVRVWLPSEPIQDIWIPSQLIHQHGQMEYVYLVHDSKAAMRLVKTGKRQSSEGLTQILSGLKEGDMLITSSSEDLTDGHLVTIR